MIIYLFVNFINKQTHCQYTVVCWSYGRKQLQWRRPVRSIMLWSRNWRSTRLITSLSLSVDSRSSTRQIVAWSVGDISTMNNRT